MPGNGPAPARSGAGVSVPTEALLGNAKITNGFTGSALRRRTVQAFRAPDGS
ncbi:hypothetical protein ACIG56_11560 [Nocardia fusca]|uniref:hypothetical protein n=1 Tax=Nocardia fusca TaxID=941183 RepID=UPI0037CC136F